MIKSIVLAVALAACTSATSTGITSDTLTCDPTLTYTGFGADFVSTNCLSCHAAKERPALATQAQIQANQTAILQNAVFTTAMPQDADLSTEERKLLGSWLTCGAP